MRVGGVMAPREAPASPAATAVAEALRLLKETKGKFAPEVCAVSNVQEEVGLLGARQIAYSLKPDIALVVDVTHATDYPTVSKAQHGDVKIGEGPAVTHGGCNHPDVVARLEFGPTQRWFRAGGDRAQKERKEQKPDHGPLFSKACGGLKG